MLSLLFGKGLTPLVWLCRLDRVGFGYVLASMFISRLTIVARRIGSIPFILREHLSYSQLATFALSSYPYSLKLLWSPVVDAVYFSSVGRRKSWIIPMQTVIGSMMLWMSFTVQELMDNVCASPIHSPFDSARADVANAGNGTYFQADIHFHEPSAHCRYAR